jgi:hypothetical protein
LSLSHFNCLDSYLRALHFHDFNNPVISFFNEPREINLTENSRPEQLARNQQGRPLQMKRDRRADFFTESR